jgi:hypothetical protein
MLVTPLNSYKQDDRHQESQANNAGQAVND